MTAARQVGGLDGCRAGWVLAVLTLPPSGTWPFTDATVEVVPHFRDALARVLDGSVAALAVDMPIGLPDAGPREADRAARRRLGPRRSSVFPTPVRATLGAIDYPDALARSRAGDGRGLSKQAYHLLPRIAEVDESMTPDLQDRVFECHPETAFAGLAGGPLLTTKRQAVGREERRDLLAPLLAASAHRVLPPGARAPSGARPDDVLDAIVNATVAARFVTGDVERLGDGAVDRRGLRMEIVV